MKGFLKKPSRLAAMVDYKAAFKLPFSNWKRSGFLFLLVLIISLAQNVLGSSIGHDILPELAPFIVLSLVFSLAGLLVNLFLAGYGIMISNYAIRGINELPPFENIGKIMKMGLQVFAFIIILLLGALIVLGIPIGALAFIGLAKSQVLSAILILLIVIIAIILFLFLLYLMPLLTANFSHKLRFSAFFEIKKSIRYAFTSVYFVAWLVSESYILLLILLSFAISMPTYPPRTPSLNLSVGLSVLGAAYSLLFFTALSIYGQAYRKVAGISGQKHPVNAKKGKKPAKRSRK